MPACSVRVRIPATTANIGCGFDTFGMALGYYNYIDASLAESLSVTAIGEGANYLSLSDNNLIVRSAAAAYELAGMPFPKLAFRLENNIPLGRGMGSSSAAIVGGIYTANSLMGNPLNDAAMLDLANRIEGHCDNVAPAIYGGFTIIVTENDQCHVKRIALPDSLQAILAVPNFKISTKKARGIMPKAVPLTDAVYSLSRAAYLAVALAQGDLSGFGSMLSDRLHQPYRTKLINGADEVMASAIAAGALGCVISGSGPSIIAFAEKDDFICDNIGMAMSDAFYAVGVGARIISTQMDNSGVCLIDK